LVKLVYTEEFRIKWTGAETGHIYEFAPGQVRWVDKRDVPDMLKREAWVEP